MKQTLLLLTGLFISTLMFSQAKAKAVVDYAVENLDKKIDRGECWDLIAFALDHAEAKWEMPFDFGNKIDYKKDALQPGDIISFDGVKFENENGYMTFPMHYAIVYKVVDKDHITILHQNHNNKKVVQTLDLTLSDLKKGTMQFFRVRED
ncbi:MAG: CHAP domain-containing protein [Flavobacteriales bacterium]|nr:CHAP domain-containing protein [Flavobacteriales bacterium]